MAELNKHNKNAAETINPLLFVVVSTVVISLSLVLTYCAYKEIATYLYGESYLSEVLRVEAKDTFVQIVTLYVALLFVYTFVRQKETRPLIYLLIIHAFLINLLFSWRDPQLAVVINVAEVLTIASLTILLFPTTVSSIITAAYENGLTMVRTGLDNVKNTVSSYLADRNFRSASCIFVALMALVVWTRYDIAISDNERAIWEYTGTTARGFRWLFTDYFTGGLHQVAHSFWPYDELWHPPFARYVAALIYLMFHSASSFECFRIGTGLFFVVGVCAIYYLISKQYGLYAGVFSAISIVLIPDVFTHAHYIGTDTPMAVMWVLTAFAFFYATTRLRQACFAVIFGLAILTKLQALFIPIPLILWSYYLYRIDKKAPNPISWSLFFLTIIITPLTVLVLWPLLWENPLKVFVQYLNWAASVPKDTTLYFGSPYGGNHGDSPWHYPFVILGIRVPVLILLMGLVGMYALFRDRLKDKVAVFIFLNMITGLLLTSVFGGWQGSREFLSSFYFMGAMAGVGFAYICNFVATRVQVNKKNLYVVALLIILTVPSFISWVRVYPYGLFYYNALIGGAKGAREAEMERSYWCNENGRDLINFLNKNVEPNSIVSYDMGTAAFIFPWYQEMGLLRRDIILKDIAGFDKAMQNSDYIIINPENKNWEINNNALSYYLEYDGIPLIGVVKPVSFLKAVFPEKPDIQNPQNHAIGRDIRFLGYNISSRQFHPGETLDITYFWMAEKKTEERISCNFLLLNLDCAPPRNTNRPKDEDLFSPNHGSELPFREARIRPSLIEDHTVCIYPIEYWPPGKVFRQKFQVRIPKDKTFLKDRYVAALTCGINNICLGEIVVE